MTIPEGHPERSRRACPPEGHQDGVSSSKGAAEGLLGAREELFSADEVLAATEHEKILVRP